MTPVKGETLQALSAGIKAEAAAYVFYITAAAKAEASSFKDILAKLAHEEKEHFHILERQHDSLVRSEKWVSTADILKGEGLPEIPEDMMASHRELMSEVQDAVSVRTLLEIAYRLEEEAYGTYSREIARADSEEGRKIFTQLAGFEQGHMRVIEELMVRYA
ncbi:MAG TPA: ferritin family protein [Acidobacteriota bacterium]|nr:ferritin family protein [Acidobacteriota bacterium]